MLALSERLSQANRQFASYAVPHSGGLGRIFPEAEDETRFPFQRDRDRIIHAQAFRRLKHKTQVFVAGHGDHFRTRVTHTLEVAQISRDMARTLGLNEDLAEAIALAHDLGHTPFGHSGEEAMKQCMEPFGSTFEHNEQSLRVVTVLEERSKKYLGLNLNQEVLEGLMKHRTPHDMPTDTSQPRSPSLEAQIVNLADEIAYTAADTDDGLRAELFNAGDVRQTMLGKRAGELAAFSGTEIRGSIVHLLASDIYENFPQRLSELKITSLADVYSASEPIVRFSDHVQTELAELRSLLWNRLYLSAPVQAQANRGKLTVQSLFAMYTKNPPPKVLSLVERSSSTLHEAVKDYIAGMTDGYAGEQLEKLAIRKKKILV